MCFWASVAVNATLLLAVAPAAHAAFPGHNGFIAYVHTSHSSEGEEGEGPSTLVRSLMVGRLFGRERFTLRAAPGLTMFRRTGPVPARTTPGLFAEWR